MDKKSGKDINRGRKGDLFLFPSLSTSALLCWQDSEPRSDSSIDESMPRNLEKEKETMANWQCTSYKREGSEQPCTNAAHVKKFSNSKKAKSPFLVMSFREQILFERN
uniref:Uncharacterized protein n=1 Tax=Nelumbo nucifera TaxID=4432 RepID=A0A822Y1W7_NELNU|nr:TPA_asm: hypothetical protein HUJ06_026730 [Nelumbo nucifera]